MVSLNRVLLIGNLTKDPELRYTPSGIPVASLRLAVNSSFKNQAGQRKEETCFITVIVWSKQAEICNQYLKKGRSVFIEGRLLYRTWEAEGQKRSTMEVRADRVQFLGPPPAGAQVPYEGTPGQVRGTPSEPGGGEPSEEVARAEVPEGEPAAESGSDADVPF